MGNWVAHENNVDHDESLFLPYETKSVIGQAISLDSQSQYAKANEYYLKGMEMLRRELARGRSYLICFAYIN